MESQQDFYLPVAACSSTVANGKRQRDVIDDARRSGGQEQTPFPSLLESDCRPQSIQIRLPADREQLRVFLLPRDTGKRRHRKISNKPPRPLNAFMLYRQVLTEVLRGHGFELAFDKLSKLLGCWWNNETTDTKESFRRLSAEAEDEHRIMFPTYKYKPEAKAKAKMSQVKIRTKENSLRVPTQPDYRPEPDLSDMGAAGPELAVTVPSVSPVPDEDVPQTISEGFLQSSPLDLGWNFSWVAPSFHPPLDIHLSDHHSVPPKAPTRQHTKYFNRPELSINTDFGLLPPTEQMAEEGSPIKELAQTELAVEWGV